MLGVYSFYLLKASTNCLARSRYKILFYISTDFILLTECLIVVVYVCFSSCTYCSSRPAAGFLVLPFQSVHVRGVCARRDPRCQVGTDEAGHRDVLPQEWTAAAARREATSRVEADPHQGCRLAEATDEQVNLTTSQSNWNFTFCTWWFANKTDWSD